MKKRFLIALILAFTAFPTTAFGSDADASDYTGFGVTPEDLELYNVNFFKSPTSTIDPNIRQVKDDSFYYDPKEAENAPLVKQIRLRLTDIIYNKKFGKKKQLDVLSEYEQSNRSTMERLQFWKKKQAKNETAEQQEETANIETDKGTLSESIQDHIDTEVNQNGEIALESGISEQIVQKELLLDSEKVSFDEETGDMVASGHPVLTLPQQNTKIVSDKMTYNQDSNTMKCIGNVVVSRNGMETYADYIEVDMNEETLISENLEIQPTTMKMNAKKALQKDGLIILNEGYLHSDQSEIHRLSSRMVGPKFGNIILDEDDQSFILSNPEGNNIDIYIKNLYVEARKNHDVIKAKGIEVKKNGKKLFTWPSLTTYTNKERDYFEANYPELGSRRKLGMYVGPGFTFGGPNGSVIKLIPFLNYKNKIGVGGALKYRTPFNSTELGYGTSNEIFFLRGEQKLDDHLYLQYGANSYVDDWFIGARMPRYTAEVYYDKKHHIKDFLTEDRDLTFRHRFGFGLMQDNDQNFYGEKIKSNEHTTTRLRYMAEVRQTLYSYKKPEERIFFNLDLVMQGSAAVYGTGDTQFIARFGPRAHFQYKNWMQDFGYFQTGYDDKTPLPRYDSYRYGHSSVYLSEVFRINKYLSVGWSGTVNLSNDSPNGKLFQENRFAVAIGPDDLKVRLGYDFVRQSTYFGFDMAFDTKGTDVHFGKMEIKNPERLGRRVKAEDRQIAFAPAEKPISNKQKSKNKEDKPTVLKYAQVIDLEDPDKELVD